MGAPSAGPGGVPVRRPRWMDRTDRRRFTHEARGPSRTEARREAAMADWYGEERAAGEMAARRSAARPVAAILDEALRAIGLADARHLDQVLGLWPALVGVDVARRTRPMAYRGGVLTVEVASASWLYVLDNDHRERIRDRVREATAGAVVEVRFIPPGRQAGRRPENHAPGAVPGT